MRTANERDEERKGAGTQVEVHMVFSHFAYVDAARKMWRMGCWITNNWVNYRRWKFYVEVIYLTESDTL